MNTSELISALKIRGSFPTTQELFSTSDFLVLLNMAMKVEINPMMLKLNDEYLLETMNYEVGEQGELYRLPKRAISLRDLKLVDGSGNESDLPRNFEEDRAFNRTGYYIVRNSLQLSNDINSGTLRLKFFSRPSNLVETSACGQIVAIDTDLNQVEIGTAPGTFVNGALMDFVQNENPYDLMAYDQAISNISGTTVTFDSLPEGLAIGDWVTLANQSPVPLAPEEMHVVLVQAALVSALSAKKDKSYQDELKALMQMKADVISMLDPRMNNTSAKMRAGKLHNFFSNGWF